MTTGPRAILKLLRLFLLLGAFIAAAWAGRLALGFSPRRRRRLCLRLTSFTSRRILLCLGIRVRADPPPDPRRRGRLVATNHLSYLDVLIIASVEPSVFVTSEEVREAPFLGTLAACGGSLFVERRSRMGVRTETAALCAPVREDLPVVLFAEATSSDGRGVLPFHPVFFEAARATGTSVQPACIHYEEVNGRPIAPWARDSLFYYGDMGFFGHIRRLVRLDAVGVRLSYLEEIAAGPESNRKDLARRAHAAVAASYVPLP